MERKENWPKIFAQTCCGKTMFSYSLLDCPQCGMNLISSINFFSKLILVFLNFYSEDKVLMLNIANNIKGKAILDAITIKCKVGNQLKNSILIKPTYGSFQRYSNNDLLHC